MKYFGTDGIRGEVTKDITHNLAFDCGNALCAIKKTPKIVIGKDSRLSKDYLSLAFSLGVIYGGGSVDDVGVCTSGGVAYLAKDYDYGVMISASHNPPNHNGIKIFLPSGEKFGEENEKILESILGKHIVGNPFGQYKQRGKLAYEKFLENSPRLDGLKIVLDCCYGASCKIAPKVFKNLGATIKVINKHFNGNKINVNCGATNVLGLKEQVLNFGADLGLAFDGDGDRVIAVDELGNIVDGDKILYVLAKDLKIQNRLENNLVVGTILTNRGISSSLDKDGVTLIEANVGDKYVYKKMKDLGASIGGEKAGHIILKDKLKTGDGILTGLALAGVIKNSKLKLSQLSDVELFCQCEANIKTDKKNEILANKQLCDFVENLKKSNSQTKIILRKSGTENLIRVMVEDKDKLSAQKIANLISEKIKKLLGGICAE